MEGDLIHINGVKYGPQEILEEIIGDAPIWKKAGLTFVSQLLDPHFSSFQFHTSGTTGNPKEIGFGRDQVLWSAKNTCKYFGINHTSKLLLCLPTHFVAGKLMITRAFVTGAELIWIEPSLNPLANIPDINFAAFTPAQVATIISEKDTKANFEKIEQVIIGGGEISSQLEKELEKFKNKLFATYGMTETLTHVAVRRIGDSVYHSIYKEAVFSVNENDCLVIELPFIGSGKIITQDMVELLNQNSFVWKGRLDNVINSGGVKLYAEEMEKKLIEAGALKEGEFYISSMPDKVFGHIPVIVMLTGRMDTEVATFLTTINGLLNKLEAVKHVVFLDKFEFTQTGKLKRQRF